MSRRQTATNKPMTLTAAAGTGRFTCTAIATMTATAITCSNTLRAELCKASRSSSSRAPASVVASSVISQA
jgi:hypothetical protein